MLTDLSGRVEVILDGGPTLIGLESTVIDLTAFPVAEGEDASPDRVHIERMLPPFTFTVSRILPLSGKVQTPLIRRLHRGAA